VLKVVADKILYTETWLWKQGFSAKQKWLRSRGPYRCVHFLQ
jgi:hypothetical protein